MITVYPKEYFLIQIIFAKRVSEIEDVSFEEAIQDYTNIAEDLLNISEYPPNNTQNWKNIFQIIENTNAKGICNKWFEYYKTLQHSEWKSVNPETLEYGMFSYSLYPNNATINLHAGNRRRGEEYSSFSSKYHNENKKDLYNLIKKVSKQYSTITKVRCSSWINNIPTFINLFPKEYRYSLVVKDSNNFLGIWQQFLDKDGKIKKELMEEFIKQIDSSQSIEALKNAFPCNVIIGEIDIEYFNN